MKKFLAIVLLISSLSFSLADAHPFIVKTQPAQSSNVSPGINEIIIIHYSEQVEKDYSTIKVLDSSGNQVDNKDTKYFEDEDSLAVTTKPLRDGVYTVTSKVLSKVDGHIVDEAFVFAIGSAKVLPPPQKSERVVYLPEAGARFPGMVGQVIVLGAAISSFLIWNPIRKKTSLRDSVAELDNQHSHAFLKLTGVGLFLVLTSNIVMLAVQSIALQTSALSVIQTGFGTTWLARMFLTIVLLGIWFWAERKSLVGRRQQILILGFSLALIATTTMMGHGVASMQKPAAILDFVHNLLASIWIGGIIYLTFVILPSFRKMDSERKESLTLAVIPRFSIMFVVALGILVITGPTLLWFLESDVSLLFNSAYGKLILAKIIVASMLVLHGAYNQFKIQRPAEKNFKEGTIQVHSKLRRSLRTEIPLGIVLLGIVALLTNSSLPAGEIQGAQAQEIITGFHTIQFSNQAKFDISITPFSSGANTLLVSVVSPNGETINDISDLKVKISNAQKNIAPIELNVITKSSKTESIPMQYIANATFGFSGTWHVEIEAMRTRNANDNVSFDVLIKPKLSDLKTSITEYAFPASDVAPLYPVFDGKDTIWISDTSKPRIWKFNIDDRQFKSYDFEGQISVTLNIDNTGKIWYTDSPKGRIGFFDPASEKFTKIDLPFKATPIAIEHDLQDNIWVALVDKSMLLKYKQDEKKFDEFKTPTPLSSPTYLLLDKLGNIWFTEATGGKIGVINSDTGQISEFAPEGGLKEPTALFFDNNGNLWISEHTGLSFSKFDPILKIFYRIPVSDSNALPFGMTSDKFGNIWLAQHTVDKLGVYDPHNNNFEEIPVPTKQSFVQFITSDSYENVWIVEQRGQKLGMVSITEVPKQPILSTSDELKIKYADLVSPLIGVGIIATSLFFVKGVKDKRRIDSLIT